MRHIEMLTYAALGQRLDCSAEAVPCARQAAAATAAARVGCKGPFRRCRGEKGAQKKFSTSAVGFLQRSVLFSLKPHFGTDFLLLSRRDNMQGGRMSISTLILILLLTFGAACALDRFARAHLSRRSGPTSRAGSCAIR
jgi:hypothetical protein